MAGQALRVIPRQTLNFSYLGASATETRVVAGKIPSGPYTQGSLLVRVHGKSIGGGSLVVNVILDASTAEDPNATFLGATALGTVTVDANSTVGGFSLAPLVGQGSTAVPLGSMVAIQVKGLQSGTPGDDLIVDLSADLILKSA